MFEHLDDPRVPPVPSEAYPLAVRRGAALRARRRTAVIGGVTTGALLALLVAVVPSVRGAGRPAPGAAAAPTASATASSGPASASATPGSVASSLTGPALAQLCEATRAKARTVAPPAGFAAGRATVTEAVQPGGETGWRRPFTTGSTVLTLSVDCVPTATPLRALSLDEMAKLRPDADSSVSVSMTQHGGLPARVVTSRRGDEVSVKVQPSPYVTVSLDYHQPAGAALLSVGQLWDLVDGMHLPPA